MVVKRSDSMFYFLNKAQLQEIKYLKSLLALFLFLYFAIKFIFPKFFISKFTFKFAAHCASVVAHILHAEALETMNVKY